MTKKKKLTLRTSNCRNKNTSKGKGKKSNTVANSVTLKNQCTDLKSKFKLKELRIILHDIAADNIILQHKKYLVTKNVGSLKVVDKCEKYINKEIYLGHKKSSVNDIVNAECSTVTFSAIAIEKHDTDDKLTEIQNINNDFDIQTKLLNAEGQETCFYRHVEVLPISDSNGNKQIEEFRVANDIECTPKPENTNLSIAVTNSNQNLSLDLLYEATSVPDTRTGNTEGKQNINFNEQNVETCVTKKNLIKDKCLIVQTDEESPKETQKILKNLKNTTKVTNKNFPQKKDVPMKDKCLIVQTDEESPKETQKILKNLKNMTKVKNKNFPQKKDLPMKDKWLIVQTDEESPKKAVKILMKQKNTNKVNNPKFPKGKDLPMKDKCPSVRNDEESPKKTQNILMNLTNTNKVNNENFPEERNLPKITEEKILAKNTILLQAPNNMQTANNLQDKAYSTNAVLQNKCKECLSIEKHGRVVDLTEDNLHKFTENYDKGPVSPENVTSLNATENLQSSANSSTIEITLKTNQDDLYVPYRKRGWIAQKTIAEPDKTDIKRIRLNRKCIQETSCTTKSSSVCLSDNKNSNLISKCHSQDDDRLTLHSNDDNSLCTIQLKSALSKAEFNDILRSTHVEKENFSGSSPIIFNGENEKNELLLTEKYHQNAENTVENNLNENKILNCSTQLDPQNQVESKINDNHNDDHNDGSYNVDHSNDCSHDDNYNNGGGEDENCNNDTGDDDNCNNDAADDDYISLFTDSLLSVDPMIVTSNENRAKNTSSDYKMTRTILNKYFQQNILECNKEFDTIQEHDTSENKDYEKSYQAQCEKIEQNSIPALEKQSINVESISSVSPHVINNNNGLCFDNNYNKYKENVVGDDKTELTCTKQMEPITCQGICRGYCFSKMRHGDCNKTQCHFNHDLQTLIRNIILKYKQYLTSIIHYTYSMKYHYFLKRLYLLSIQECNVACILDLYEKLYSMQYAHSDIVCITVQALLNKGMHLKNVVDSLCKILISTDKWTPKYILNSVKDNIEVGEYWDILRNLVTYVKPTIEVIENILNDCLITRKHIQDVHVNLIKRLHPTEVNQLNRNLMLSFNNLVIHEYQETLNKTSPQSTSVSNNNEGCFKETYTLQAISDLPETHSQYRDRFWKLYLMIYNIKEALVHKDYDYVISILTKYEEMNEDETLFSRCCFHMLTAEIKHSEYHISKIIEHAVQIGASSILYKVLLDVATYILMKLIIKNAWALAYKLLKTLQIYNLQHNAAFIILSAEIYLANKHAIKALMLIKQSNIISTNRDNWNVASNAQDYYPRTNIIGILLDVLCINSPEHAFFIFQFLTKDQGNNFRPIDLTYYVDKLMLKLLIEREIDLIVKMGYMIIEYNFTFFNITICRAVIASVIHIDTVLAKQLYQYASGLGIYRTIELLPVIHVIINVDWVEEEIFLTFWDLFQRLVMDIGHSIDHLNPAELSIYIIFEIVPTEANLYYENLDEQQMKKIQVSKNLVRQVLRSRFEPSILLSKKKVNGTIMKLQNKVVMNHLKGIYKNYIE